MVQVSDIRDSLLILRGKLTGHWLRNSCKDKEKPRHCCRGLMKLQRNNRGLAELPFSTWSAARRAVAIEFPATAIDHLGEVAADPVAAAIFPVGDDIAVIVAVAVPFMALAHPAPETVVI